MGHIYFTIILSVFIHLKIIEIADLLLQKYAKAFDYCTLLVINHLSKNKLALKKMGENMHINKAAKK